MQSGPRTHRPSQAKLCRQSRASPPAPWLLRLLSSPQTTLRASIGIRHPARFLREYLSTRSNKRPAPSFARQSPRASPAPPATPLRRQPRRRVPTAAIAFGPPRCPSPASTAVSPLRPRPRPGPRPDVPNVGASREPRPRGPDAGRGQPHHPFPSQGALR